MEGRVLHCLEFQIYEPWIMVDLITGHLPFPHNYVFHSTTWQHLPWVNSNEILMATAGFPPTPLFLIICCFKGDQVLPFCERLIHVLLSCMSVFDCSMHPDKLIVIKSSIAPGHWMHILFLPLYWFRGRCSTHNLLLGRLILMALGRMLKKQTMFQIEPKGSIS